MKQRILAIREIYKEGKASLEREGLGEAELDAWYLLEYVTGISRASYYAYPEREISEEQRARYFDYIEERKKRIPLQHLTGEQEFMGLKFIVNRYVLIPRQDTEILVEEALKLVKPGMRILDMCTGSGCILLSILKLCGAGETCRAGELCGTERLCGAEESCGAEKLCRAEQPCKTESVRGIGTDISGEALSVAEENAKRLDISADFKRGDLFGAVDAGDRFDLIVSNPPYIPTSVIDGLQEEVRLHDPYIALDGREDGLYFYKRIVKDSISCIKRNGFLLFEIGCEQAEAVSGLMEGAGYENVTVKKDLAGLDRVVMGMYNGE